MPLASRSTPAPALVLLSCGPRQQIQALQHEGAATLARILGLALAPPLRGDDTAIAALPAGALTPLAIDPGLPLAAGGYWAEILGAWRQSALVLLNAEQLQSGTPAAATALLQQWQVPLLGLVQWGGRWDDEARRRDGLPWLGWLDGSAEREPAVALALAAGLRWRQLAAAAD